MNYYLYIEPYTLFFRKKGECLFYNTLNKKVLKIDVSNDMYFILDKLKQINTLYYQTKIFKLKRYLFG